MPQHGTTMEVTVRNVGGIDQRTEVIQRGATALVGENATNRTSFLQAIGLVFGADTATLKRDAEEGEVVLDWQGDQYRRQLRRTDDGQVRTDGDGVLADDEAVELAETYAFLLADNDIRRAVRAGGDPDRLYELLMAPVDRERIDRRIDQLTDRRRELEERLSDLDTAADELEAARAERDELESKLRGLRRETAELERRQAELRADGEGDDRADELGDRRRELRERLDDVDDRLRNKRDQLDSARSELESLSSPDRDEAELQEAVREAKREKTALVERRDELDSRLDRLEPLRSAHAQFAGSEFDLDQLVRQFDIDPGLLPDGPLLSADAATDGGADELSAQLLDDEERQRCTVCGSRVTPGTIEAGGDQIAAVTEAVQQRRDAVDEEVAAARERERELRETLDERNRTENRRRQLQSDVDRLEGEVADLEEERAAVESELSAVEDELERARAAATDEDEATLIEAVQELRDVEDERATTERRLDELDDRIATLTERLDRRDEVASELSDVASKLETQRGRIERVERELVGSFNERMAAVVDRLEYDNIARIWLELRRSGDDAALTLNVAREADDGAVYDDAVGNLSESEREVVGLTVALTGYVVHDVGGTVPIMLLDSVEMIDGDRLDTLIDHFEQHQDHLVAAVLPGHAERFDESVNRLAW